MFSTVICRELFASLTISLTVHGGGVAVHKQWHDMVIFQACLYFYIHCLIYEGQHTYTFVYSLIFPMLINE